MSQVPHKCPICDGTGLVMRPPGVAGDQYSWTSSSTGPYVCRVCAGVGVIWGPPASAQEGQWITYLTSDDPHANCFPGRPCSTTCPCQGYKG